LKKIALITTGGTIGSSVIENKVTLAESKNGALFTQNPLGNIGIDIISAINKSSEDIVPEDWIDILQAIQNANNDYSYEGIVITHGTDTLAYSLSAILSYERYLNKPVCVTGSFYAPDHPKSDAAINLQAALNAVVENLPAGAYVAFRSNINNSRARISHASTLLPMSFNDRYFEYIHKTSVGSYSLDKKLKLNKTFNSLSNYRVPELPSNKLPEKNAILNAQKKIASIKLYPGIDLSTFEALAHNKEIVIVELYHSGTGPSFNKGSLVEFLENNSKNIKVFMGAFPSDYIQYPYTSSVKLIESGALIYNDLQPPYLYAFSLLGLSLGFAPEYIAELLSPWELKMS